MKFKNELEKHAFCIAKDVFGNAAKIEHNKVIQIENAIFPEVASFSGPPKKEIDILTAHLLKDPKLHLLVSCKEFSSSKSEPAHVQEWAAVVKTMSQYADETTYLGLILSTSGFTAGCEPWATSSNLALIPPLKGKGFCFAPDTSLTMFERVLRALRKRLCFPYQDILMAPGFYDFAYQLTADFEGHNEGAGDRYILADSKWHSSFAELVSMLMGRAILDIVCSSDYLELRLESESLFRFDGTQIVFGRHDGDTPDAEVSPICRKNLSHEECSFEFLRDLVVGHTLTSAADFGTYFEFGLSNEINLGFYPGLVLHIVSTKNPIEENEL